MKKAIVVTAVGSQYEALYKKVAPTFEQYAARHDWDIKVVSALPEGFAAQHGRPSWNHRDLCCAFRLYQPTMFADYDLLALMDPDMIIHPAAPCLSSYFSDIPDRGLAAVQDVSFSDRKLFRGWSRYHYDDFLDAEGVAKLPFPTLHVNTGVVLVKPSEVKEEWRDLMTLDSDISDEDRVNLAVTQEGRALLLPGKWNVVYPYELVRRGYQVRALPKRGLARRVAYQFDVRVTQQRWIRELLQDAWVLHFASTDKNVIMHLDIPGLLATA